MKRYQAIAFLLSTAMTVSTAVPAFAAASDINGHWAQATIEAWQNEGRIGGYEDGTFRPDQSITRAEFVRLLNSAVSTQGSAAISFSDVSPSDWYYNDVAKAVGNNIASGFEDGTFKPNETVTRMQAAVFISNALMLTSNEAGANGFTDAAQLPAWAKGAVGAVVAGGYMSGYPDGSFGGSRGMTRAEAVSTLDRVLKGGNTTQVPSDTTEPTTPDTSTEESTSNEGNMVWQSGGKGSSSSSGGGGGGGSSSSDDSKYKNVTIKASNVSDYAGKTLTGTTSVYVDENGIDLSSIKFNGDVRIYAQQSTATASAYDDVAVAAVYLSDIKVKFGSSSVSGDIIVVSNDIADSQVVIESAASIKALEARTATKVAGSTSVTTIKASASIATEEGTTVNTIEATTGAFIDVAGSVRNIATAGQVGEISIKGSASPKVSVEGTVTQITLSGTAKADITVENGATIDKIVSTSTQTGTTVSGNGTVTQIVATDPSTITNNTETPVEEIKAESIAVSSQPTKLSYKENETLDLTGLVVTVTYTGGTRKDVALADFTAEGITTTPANGATLTAADNGKGVTITMGTLTATTSALTVESATTTVSATASGTVAGTIGNALTQSEITITLTNGTFTGLSENQDVTSWITNLSAIDSATAMTAAIKAGYVDGGNSLTIVFSGNPDTASSAAISIEIPQANVSGATGNVTADGATFSITDPTAVSAAASGTVAGTTGTALSGQEITITLTNGTFTGLNASDDVASWITNLSDAGSSLTATIKAGYVDGGNSLTIELGGTPDTATTNAISIEIPQANVSGATGNVTASGANFNITDSTAVSAAASGTVAGTTGSALSGQEITITLTNGTFTGLNASDDVASWITNLSDAGSALTATIKAGYVDGGNSLTIELGGTPDTATTNAISIEIPQANVSGATGNVTASGANFNITDSTAVSAAASGTVAGTTGTALSGQEITITLTNGTFTGLNASDDVASWITNLSDAGSALTATIKAGYVDGGNSLTIELGGTPDTATTNAISIEIPQANVSGATGNVTASGANFNITDSTAVSAAASGTVAGTTGTALSGQEITITLTNGTFTGLNASDDVASWITNLSDAGSALTATIKAGYVDGGNSLTIELGGTPDTATTNAISIEIPQANVSGATGNVTASGANFNITDSTAVSAAASGTVAGTTGSALSGQEITITLTNGTFTGLNASDDVASWITNLSDAGSALTATIKAGYVDGGNSLTIELGGTPDTATTNAISIEIPQANVSGATGNVTASGANFNIAAPAATATASGTVEGTTGSALTQSEITITLTNGTFTGLTESQDVKSWITNLNAIDSATAMTATIKTGYSDGGNTLTIVLGGNPDTASSAAISIEIPQANVSGATGNVTADGATFNVTAPAATATASGTVTGTNGSALSGQEITITLTNGTFTGLNASDDVASWITNLSDAGSALTATIKAGYSDGQNSLTIEINGTPDQTTSAAISIEIPQANVSGATGNVTASGATFSIS